MVSDIRKMVREVLKESFWTDKDWDDYLSSQSDISSKESNSELYSELENFLIKKKSFSELDALEVMNISKKLMPDVNEYDLIDLVKFSLSEIERNNDEMDGIIRGRAKRAWEMVDDFYLNEKINEVVSAVATTSTDNEMADSGVSAVATTSTDNEMADSGVSAVQEESKEKLKTKKRKPKDMGKPYTMSLPSGSFFNF
tara:strand:+ start:5135 stop:5728 length:594 start_codon:yes stop_codon:yes gene_type:complete